MAIVSTVSDDAPCFDTNTPNTSSDGKQFNETDRKILKQCEDFAGTLIEIICDLETNGRTDRTRLPDFPRAEFLRIMGVNNQKKDLIGLELHEYLLSKLAPVGVLDGEITPPLDCENWTLENFLLTLNRWHDILKGMNAKTLHALLNYGLWLNLAYERFELCKGDGLVRGTWDKWLKTNVGISESYARQLRYLSAKYYEYNKMHNLSIPIRELYNRRYQIINMLENDQSIANFWRGN